MARKAREISDNKVYHVMLRGVNNLPYNKEENGDDLDEGFVIARALDEITSMKILSRIDGDESKVSKSFLGELAKTIKACLESVSGVTFAITGEDNTTKSVSLAKLDEMTKRLESGYTSFWS